MTSPNEVPELLRRLRDALAGAPTLSPHDRELLEQLSDEIHGLLAKPGASPPARSALSARLAEAVTRFEVTHPDLSNVLASASKVLGDMGI